MIRRISLKGQYQIIAYPVSWNGIPTPTWMNVQQTHCQLCLVQSLCASQLSKFPCQSIINAKSSEIGSPRSTINSSYNALPRELYMKDMPWVLPYQRRRTRLMMRSRALTSGVSFSASPLYYHPVEQLNNCLSRGRHRNSNHLFSFMAARRDFNDDGRGVVYEEYSIPDAH